MAFFCLEGRKWECDGCGHCRYTEVEGECYNCGITVYIDDDFDYVGNKLYCEKCANEIEED